MNFYGYMYMQYPKYLPDDVKDIWEDIRLMPNSTLQKMYRDRTVTTSTKSVVKYTSGISPREGFFIYSLAAENLDIKKILEVGMANGTSALYILQAVVDRGETGHLLSLDPFQTEQWGDAGTLNVQAAKLDSYHELRQVLSEIGMPSLLAEGSKFDMVFVDGMHLFDNTLLDIFYAVRLLRKGGLLVVDDIKHRGVKKAIDFVDKNYKFIRRIKDHVSKDTMALYVVEKDDTRNWNHYINF
jgi:predicted O-methyltransferase YrrM